MTLDYMKTIFTGFNPFALHKSREPKLINNSLPIPFFQLREKHGVRNLHFLKIC